MLLMSEIAWILLKIVYTGVKFHASKHTKVFRYIMAYGENFLTRF